MNIHKFDEMLKEMKQLPTRQLYSLVASALIVLTERVEALEAKPKGISFSFRERDNLRAYLNIESNDARTIELPDDTFNYIFAAINYPQPQKDMTARNHTERSVMMKIGSTTFIRAKKETK